MPKDSYTSEQQKDIEERVEQAHAFLKDLNLQPGVIVQPVNLGDDVFGFKPIPYLQDNKYIKSPIQV